MSDSIRLELSRGVARITLDRPDTLNAFGDDMREQLIAALDRVAAGREASVLVITGAGRAFCAGGDVRHMAALKARGDSYEALAALIEAGTAIVSRIAALPIPTLAAVKGPAAGAGLNLALACDLRLASERATFGETFVRIGLHPDWGGTYFLPRRVGLEKALELCWTGDVIDAAEALRIGLVGRVVPHDRFEAEVTTLAERLAAAPRVSVRLIKQSLRAALARPLAECLDAEAEAQQRCWAAPDVAEGLEAFLHKRAPHFGGSASGRSASEAANATRDAAPLTMDEAAEAAAPRFE